MKSTRGASVPSPAQYPRPRVDALGPRATPPPGACAPSAAPPPRPPPPRPARPPPAGAPPPCPAGTAGVAAGGAAAAAAGPPGAATGAACEPATAGGGTAGAAVVGAGRCRTGGAGIVKAQISLPVSASSATTRGPDVAYITPLMTIGTWVPPVIAADHACLRLATFSVVICFSGEYRVAARSRL